MKLSVVIPDLKRFACSARIFVLNSSETNSELVMAHSWLFKIVFKKEKNKPAHDSVWDPRF